MRTPPIRTRGADDAPIAPGGPLARPQCLVIASRGSFSTCSTASSEFIGQRACTNEFTGNTAAGRPRHPHAANDSRTLPKPHFQQISDNTWAAPPYALDPTAIIQATKCDRRRNAQPPPSSCIQQDQAIEERQWDARGAFEIQRRCGESGPDPPLGARFVQLETTVERPAFDKKFLNHSTG